MRYVLDESGHGGDHSSAAAPDFAAQTVFPFAFVGVDDEAGCAKSPERARSSPQVILSRGSFEILPFWVERPRLQRLPDCRLPSIPSAASVRSCRARWL